MQESIPQVSFLFSCAFAKFIPITEESISKITVRIKSSGKAQPSLASPKAGKLSRAHCFPAKPKLSMRVTEEV